MLVVQSETARALSTDGIVWQLQIRTDFEHLPWEFVDNYPVSNAYRLYGIWSPRNGLTPLPLQPGIEVQHANYLATSLIESLNKLPEFPFPLKDSTELWLFDKEHGQPLALIASACEHDNLPQTVDLQWSPSLSGDNSLVIQRKDTGLSPSTCTLQGKRAHEYLASIVRRHCTNPPTALWIKRLPDKSGQVVRNELNQDISSGSTVSAERFPYCMLYTEHFTESEQQILKQYFRWLAPYLLSLQNVDDKIREQLEIDASRRPDVIHSLYKTIPNVVNRKLLNAALVEAELRKAAAK